MAKTISKLTARGIAAITEPGIYSDGLNLFLTVGGSGSKSWIFRYRFAGKQREMGIGSATSVSLAKARELAAKHREQIEQDIDPLEARQDGRRASAEARRKQSAIPTFDEAAKLYIAAHRHEWKNAKHAGQWQATLDTYVSPVFGSMPVDRVDTAQVLKALSDIWQTKTETATRVRGRIESILDWARVAGYRTAENPARWKGHLEHSLAAPTKTKAVVNHPALPYQQIGDFMADLKSRDGIAALALQFAILCASRSGEVRLATWSEIDLESRTWTIPAGRMKAGREHRVPLSDAAIQVLRQVPRIEGCEFIFPGAKNKPLSDMTLTAVLRRMKRDEITVHGFRSTFRDWSAEATAFDRQTAEHALAHQLPDKVEAAYLRGDLLEKRALLMQSWADYCAAPSAPKTASVTPIRGVA